jgi:hypoxanthine phosphoribosyltransferase
MKQITIQNKSFGLFISAQEIEESIKVIADRINKRFQDNHPIFISVLNGAFMFTSDLLKKIDIPCELSFVKVSSYQGTESTGIAKELVGLKEDIRNRHVIVLEDIIDTGVTISSVIHQLKLKEPATITIATLLLKPDCLKEKLHIDHIGFSIPDKFVVGYGLDLDGYGRNLSDIYQLI